MPKKILEPTKLSVHELFKKLSDKEDLVLIDVREQWEREIGTLSGSLHMPSTNFLSHVNDLDPENKTVVFCHHGYRSLQICYLLQQLGFDMVSNLEGGIDAWSKEIDPTLPLY